MTRSGPLVESAISILIKELQIKEGRQSHPNMLSLLGLCFYMYLCAYVCLRVCVRLHKCIHMNKR